MKSICTFFLALFLAIGCAETTTTSEPGDDGPATPGSAAPARTVEQAEVDPQGPNWLTAGAGGLVEIVGSDGLPEVASGRFVLDGTAVTTASGGTDRLVVAGAGAIQTVDEEASRIFDVRDVLGGETVNVVAPNPNGGWLIGGTGGALQTLDAQGEPTQNTLAAFGGKEIVAATFKGSGWAIAAADGEVTGVSEDLQAIDPSQQAFTTRSLVGIVSPGSESTSGAEPSVAVAPDAATYISPTGIPGTPIEVNTANGNISAVAFGDGNVALGTDNGKFALVEFDYANDTFDGSPTWTDVLGGNAVSQITFDGNSEWLVAGEEGQAQRLDTSGSTLDSPVTVADQMTIVGAHKLGGNWLMALGDISFVEVVGSDLSPLRDLQPVLDGEDILAASAGAPGILVAGTAGKFQLLDDFGEAVGTVGTVSGGATLRAVSWNGTEFLVVGDGGTAQRVDNQGNAVGDPSTLLDGRDARFAAWSGNAWLVGGAEGYYQRVRPDGTPIGTPQQLNGAADLRTARWGGNNWLVGGESDDGRFYFALIGSNGSPVSGPTELTETLGSIEAVDSSGIEWIVAGSGGFLHRITSEGTPVGSRVAAMGGKAIKNVSFNGSLFLIGGEHGAVRRISTDGNPLGTAPGVLDNGNVEAVVWTNPRGFFGGPCLTNTLCFSAPCVGGITDGKCCDSACDSPCVSCFAENTGEPDGTCAPVVDGKNPPDKVHTETAGCEAQSETTCGTTGVCDGAGSCAFFGAEVECKMAACSNGRYFAPSSCDGMGTCPDVEPVECAPYSGCKEETGCLDACESDEGCVDGFVCVETECVNEEDLEDTDGPDDGSDDGGDEGCCATVATGGDDPAGWLLLGLLAILIGVRRRR